MVSRAREVISKKPKLVRFFLKLFLSRFAPFVTYVSLLSLWIYANTKWSLDIVMGAWVIVVLGCVHITLFVANEERKKKDEQRNSKAKPHRSRPRHRPPA